MKTTIFAILLCLSSISNAFAASNWVLFATSSKGEEFYADSNSYKELTPTVRRIWIKTVWQTPDDGVKTATEAWEFDCLRDTVAVPSGQLQYGPDGGYIGSSRPLAHTLVAPETFKSIMRDKLCTIPAAAPSSTRAL